MARVPVLGNINMFGGTTGENATSIVEVVKHHYPGYSGGNDSNNLIAYVKANCDIEQFHPSFRPVNLSSLTDSSHFRGFPMPSPQLVWHMENGIFIA